MSNGYGSWCTREEALSLSDQLVCSVRALTAPHPDAHGSRHLPLLYNLFLTYANLGLTEKLQLLRVALFSINLCGHVMSLISFCLII